MALNIHPYRLRTGSLWPYEMRHTFVSAIQSLPEGWIKALVGHSKSMDTLGAYGHDSDGQKEKIAAGIEAIFRDILDAAT